MELSSLKIPRPVAPRLSAGDRRVQGFLRDLEKIKTTQRHRKKLKRSDMLIHRIAQCLRKLKPDHLLYTTAVWTLISIFRMLPDYTRQLMLDAGIPSILGAVMHSGSLTGSMRQYASELCFYLSSNEPYPAPQQQPAAGPLPVLPIVNVVDRYQEHMDEISLPSERSDLSSLVNDHRNIRFPFKAYRINAENMRKLEGLFNQSYEKEIAKTLPNPATFSGFGFDHRDPRIDESDSDSDDSEKLPIDDDDESVNSTISSASINSQFTSSAISSSNRSNTDKKSNNSDYYLPQVGNASLGFGSQQRKQRQHLGNISSIEATTATESHFPYDASSTTSMSHTHHGINDSTAAAAELGLGMMGTEDASLLYPQRHYRAGTTTALRSRVSAFRIGSSPVVYEEESLKPLGQQVRAQTTAAGSRAIEKQQRQQQHQKQRQQQQEREEPFFAEDTISTIQSLTGARYPDSNWKGGERKFSTPQQQQPFLLRSDVQQQLKLSPRHNNAFYNNSSSDTPLQPMSHITGGFGSSLIDCSTAAATRHAHSATSVRGSSHLLQHSSSYSTAAGVSSVNYPQLYERVHPHRQRLLSSAPAQQQQQQRTEFHFSGSNDNYKMGGDVSELLAQLDPLSLNVSIGMQSAAAATGMRSGRHRSPVRGVKFDERSSAAGSAAGNSIFDDNSSDDSSRSSNNSGGDGGRNGDEFSRLEASIDSRIEADAVSGKRNPFLVRRRQRIRAEKLVDHTFTKRLFAKNASTAQAQDLITRMQSILQLMDPQSTGFVTWECFTRLVMAVAPAHLLRADVLAFMQAQTDSEQDLIDYNEFIISGKVIVVDKLARSSGRDFMPLEGWLTRQKTFTGERSTLTWKTHVQWYQARKSKAIVWLMRRAARSLKHAVVLEDAEVFLMKQRKRALALAELMQIGFTAAGTQDVGSDARRKLLLRCMHARRWSTRVDAAQRWLVNIAKMELDEWTRRIKREEEENDPDSDLNRKLEEARIAALPRKKQADYSTFYKLYQYTNLAVQWLTARGQRAKLHVSQQDDTQDDLQAIARQQLMQMLYVEEAANWLRLTGEHAYNFCIQRDDVMKFLYRTGQSALRYLIRQQEALEWLMNIGRRSIAFMGAKKDAGRELVLLGMRTLRRLNDREDAYAFLLLKRQRADRLLLRKREAETFLRRQPYGVWAQQDRRVEVQQWLAWRGAAAVNHITRQHKALLSLQYSAGRASITQRRHDRAFTDLLQFGQEAKLDSFLLQCRRNVHLSRRLREETRRVQQLDKQERLRREKMSKFERWKAELHEAFDFLALSTTPPAYQAPTAAIATSADIDSATAGAGDANDVSTAVAVGGKRLIGRVGFHRLLMDGDLIGISHEHTYEYFKSVDPSAVCFVQFDVVWAWFLHHAQSYEATLLQQQQQQQQQQQGAAAALSGLSFFFDTTAASAVGNNSNSSTGRSSPMRAATAAAVSSSSIRPQLSSSGGLRVSTPSKLRRITSANSSNGNSNGNRGSSNSNRGSSSSSRGSSSSSREVGFMFTTPQIVSAERRALFALLKRVNSEVSGFDSEFDWDAVANNRRRRRRDEDSSSDDSSDFDEFQGMDEDALFANLDFLRRVDIGRLMRYLTKKKMQKQALAVATALAAAEAEDEKVKLPLQSAAVVASNSSSGNSNSNNGGVLEAESLAAAATTTDVNASVMPGV